METETPNKQRILEIALMLFASKGYEMSGIQEIVTDAGISKPTLYYYFGNKFGILEEIIRTRGSLMLSGIRKAAAYNHDLILHLTEILKTQIAAAQDEPEFFRLYTAASFSGTETELFKAFEPYRKQITDIYFTLFTLSVNEIGNMRGYEALYSRTFRFLAESTSLSVLNGDLTVDSHIIYRLIHSFMYGVVS